jgi:4-amino-4-deoxy-L-arabinose transferase-like glycosyltransferase
MTQQKRDLIVVAAAALLFRLPLVAVLTGLRAPEGWDAAGYFHRAMGFKQILLSLLQGDLPHRDMLAQAYTGVWPPLQSALLALFILPFDQELLFARLGTVLLACLTAVLVYLVTKRIADRKVALAAAAIFIVFPQFLHYGVRLFSETAFVFFNFVVWYLLLLLIDSEDRKTDTTIAVLLGVALGLNILTRAVGVVWIPIVFLTILYVFRITRRSVLVNALVLSAFVLTILPWQVALYVQEEKFSFITAWNKTNLYYGNLPREAVGDELREDLGEEAGILDYFDEYARRYSQERDISMDEAYQELAFRQITGEPGRFLLNGLGKWTDLWSFDVQLYKYIMTLGIPPLPNSVALFLIGASVLSYFLFLVAVVVGLGMGFSAIRYRWFVFGVLTLAMSIHFLTMAHPRLSYPLAALMLPYAGYGLAHLRMFRRQSSGRLALVLGAGFLVVAIVYNGIPARMNKIKISSHYASLVPILNNAFNANVTKNDRIFLSRQSDSIGACTIRIGSTVQGWEPSEDHLALLLDVHGQGEPVIEVFRAASPEGDLIRLNGNSWLKWQVSPRTGIAYMWSGGAQLPLRSIQINGVVGQDMHFKNIKMDVQ